MCTEQFKYSSIRVIKESVRQDFSRLKRERRPQGARVCAFYRVAKTHRMPYLYRTFSAKSPIISGSFAKKWPATEGTLWVYATLYQELQFVGGAQRPSLLHEALKTTNFQNGRLCRRLTWFAHLQSTIHNHVIQSSVSRIWSSHPCHAFANYVTRLKSPMRHLSLSLSTLRRKSSWTNLD